MRFNGSFRRGLIGSATAMAAMAALTASQAPDFVTAAHEDTGSAKKSVPDDVVWTEVPNDDVYHTELPPLESPEPPALPTPGTAAKKQSPAVRQVWAEAGIPATVLAAYRRAEASLAAGDPGCRLPWHLLAAIGKVESGHASGGRVDAAGTTLTPILGPALNGAGFAHISDTDGGAWDGDRTYDRAVGPMQFIPSTWAHWGRDGNGDGRADPNNVFDATLAAGHYLCAGSRNLSVSADLDRAILSYNHSDVYLATVRSWLEFYRRGVHPVTDGEGVVPASPGAGGPNRPKAPVGGPGSPSGGGGIVVGPQPTRPPSASPSPTAPGTPDPSATPGPSESPSDTPTPDPTDTGSPTPHPTDTGTPTPDPTDTATPDPTETSDPGATPGPTCPADPDPADTTAPGEEPDPGTPDCPGPTRTPTAAPSESTAAPAPTDTTAPAAG